MLKIDDDDYEDVRLAVVLNGGVSLAVWIGGIAREINRLSAGRDAFYRDLAQLTGSTVRADVMAGTSAGGINAPALALAEIFGRDLSSLGALWITAGGFADLLRDPFEKDSPSFLKGDAYLLPQILHAYRQLKPDTDTPEGVGRPVDLTVTGSLWHAERIPFQDSYGSQLVESVHEALFRFRREDPAFGAVEPAIEPAAPSAVRAAQPNGPFPAATPAAPGPALADD
ncbi:MAG: patatin-like phospholipase family protein, partial [Acidimicrobiales bacterium]